MYTQRIRKHNPDLNIDPSVEYYYYFKDLKSTDCLYEETDFYKQYCNPVYYINTNIVSYHYVKLKQPTELINKMKAMYPNEPIFGNVIKKLIRTPFVQEYLTRVSHRKILIFTYNYDLIREMNRAINESIIAYQNT